ncbi:hypothetical protein [Paractinoplanes durhamensis]|nr:hypothetical protein [Actinoplanes durhamensis]
MRRLLARITILIMALGAAGGGLPASADPVPITDPYAFTSADVGFNDGSDQEGQVGRIAAMDAYVGDKKPIIRVDLYWHLVQPDRDVAPDWSRIDGVIDAAHEQGVRVLLILDYSTKWANGGHDDTSYFPTDDAAWATIVRQTVAHFGSKVQAYEVWNEPNLGGQYGDNSLDVRAGRYWQLAKIAYQEVHAGCSGCVVLAGGSTGGNVYEDANHVWHGDNEGSVWLEWAYQHGMGGYLDAVAYHPYPAHYSGYLPSFAPDPCEGSRFWFWFGPDDPKCGGLAALREVMVRHGDAGKQIWGTEIGFPTDGDREPQTPEHVRDALEEGVRMWRSRPYTGPLFIYSFQDVPTWAAPCANPHNSECHFGLRDSNGNPKEPMYSDVRAALIGDNWLPTLAPGRSLFRGAAVRSANGQFTLSMQADGNLVLYDNRGGVPAPIWVRGDLRGYRLTNQHDGNLVIYDYANRPLWASNTAGRGVSTMRLQDDGSLVFGSGAGENWSVASGATAYRHVAGAQAETGTDPYEGSMYTSVDATQALGSIYQDINRTVNPGDTVCANTHVVTEGAATGGGGTFALFLTGGNAETSNKSLGNLPNGNSWTPLSTCVTATSGHSAVRVQFYPAVGGPTIGVDAVDVHLSIAKNGGFNNGFDSWTDSPGSQHAVYGPGVTGNNPYEGAGFAATNTTVVGGGIYQDVSLTVNAGDTFCGSARVASQGTARGASGSFAMWLIGGSQENSVTTYANLPGGNDWTPISACITAAAAYSKLRVQFYPDPNTGTVVIDAVDIHKSIAKNGGFNKTFDNWTDAPSSQHAVYGPGVTGNNPYEGAGFAATNTTVVGGGIYQDVNLTVKAGDTFCGSAQVASQGTTRGASGSFAMWLIGGSQENSVTTYANLPGGNDWTPISACITAAAAYSKLRVQFYPDPNTGTVVIDAVDVRQSLAVNGGFNMKGDCIVC